MPEHPDAIAALSPEQFSEYASNLAKRDLNKFVQPFKANNQEWYMKLLEWLNIRSLQPIDQAPTYPFVTGKIDLDDLLYESAKKNPSQGGFVDPIGDGFLTIPGIDQLAKSRLTDDKAKTLIDGGHGLWPTLYEDIREVDWSLLGSHVTPDQVEILAKATNVNKRAEIDSLWLKPENLSSPKQSVLIDHMPNLVEILGAVEAYREQEGVVLDSNGKYLKTSSYIPVNLNSTYEQYKRENSQTRKFLDLCLIANPDLAWIGDYLRFGGNFRRAEDDFDISSYLDDDPPSFYVNEKRIKDFQMVLEYKPYTDRREYFSLKTEDERWSFESGFEIEEKESRVSKFSIPSYTVLEELKVKLEGYRSFFAEDVQVPIGVRLSEEAGVTLGLLDPMGPTISLAQGKVKAPILGLFKQEIEEQLGNMARIKRSSWPGIVADAHAPEFLRHVSLETIAT